MAKYDFSAFDEALKQPEKKQKYDFSAFDEAAGVPEAPKQEDMPMLKSFAEGAAEGATVSLKPILAGASKSFLDTVTGISSPLDIIERYRFHRDKEKGDQDAAQSANPMSYMGGQMAGSIIPAALSAGTSQTTSPLIANNGTLYEQLLAKISPSVASAADIGAKYGAVQAFGASQGDLTKGEVLPVAQDVLQGATLGMATGAVSQGLLDKLKVSNPADALDDFAAKRAVSATGGTAGERKELIKKGRLIDHGKNLLEPNEYSDTPLITAFSKPDDILERSQVLKQNSGEAIGDILTQLDGKYSIDNPAIKEAFFSPASIVSKLKEMQQRFMKNGVIRRSTESQYNEIDKIIDDISQYGNAPITFKEADEIKQLVTSLAYDDKGKLTNELMGEARALVNDAIEVAADKVTKLVDDSALYDKYIKAKDIYRTAKDAERMSLGQTARNLTNRDLGITDYIAGSAAMVAHGTPVGVATAAGTKAIKTYGNTVAAVTTKKTAETMRTINKALVSAPDKIRAIGSQYVNSGDPIKTTLGDILIKAADKDEIGRNALIFSLMQNSKYRELMKDFTFNE